jgi:hypothetical protein
MSRLLVILFPFICLVIFLPVRWAQTSQSDSAFDQTIRPFLAKNCYMCHRERLQSGGLVLEGYKTASSVIEHRDKWERVLQKLRTGEMPPQGMPRPDETQLKAVIQWIESEFERADSQTKPDPGRVTARRLNRAEYNNTIRDLLGLDIHPADDFPQDDSGYGFDNIGDVLSLSPALMEKYISAAEKVARTAVFGPQQMKPSMVRLNPGWRNFPHSQKPLHDYDLTGLSLPNTLHVTYSFPVEGEYKIRTMLNGIRPGGSEAIQVALWIDGKQIEVLALDPEGKGSFSIDRQEFYGWAQDFRLKLTAGKHWIAASIPRLYEGLPASYGGPNPSKKPKPVAEFKPPPGAPPELVEKLRKNFEERQKEIVPANDVRVSSLEISGPFAQDKAPSLETRKRLYSCGHLEGNHGPGCARKIVAGLAHRAYRRPVSQEEVNQLVSLVATAQKEGDSFEEGICLALQAMLISPHFLFRIEKDQGATKPQGEDAHSITQHELASRLSYFLWSSMPDDELFSLADKRQLNKPDVLAAQVHRMLKDPKSRALVENFAGQWLELRKLESVKPDRKRFPDFDEYLRISMRKETEAFFDDIVRHDRSILDFIDGNYSFLNERLARFYKIPGVEGPEFRKVMLAADTRRGGVLTQASVLTVSSYATRTSPVLRGKWILDNLLGAPPPPPPPDVANLDESAIGSSASLRQQLEEHRKNATCASCHSRMDPLGFGLENFDAVGAWREQDGKFPIDSTGLLPDGRSFKGPNDLKVILKADRDAFTATLTEKLMTYGLGRGLERYDKPVVKKIAAQVAANDYRFSSLVLEIVRSLPFQMRRGDRTK